jgi:hypothetical protein
MKYTKKWMVVPYQEQPSQQPYDTIDDKITKLSKQKNLNNDLKVKLFDHFLGLKSRSNQILKTEPELPPAVIQPEVLNENNSFMDIDNTQPELVVETTQPVVENTNQIDKNQLLENLDRTLRNILPEFLLENRDILREAYNSELFETNITRKRLRAKQNEDPSSKLFGQKTPKPKKPIGEQTPKLKNNTNLSKFVTPTPKTSTSTPNLDKSVFNQNKSKSVLKNRTPKSTWGTFRK